MKIFKDSGDKMPQDNIVLGHSFCPLGGNQQVAPPTTCFFITVSLSKAPWSSLSST